jgi:NitT/TauT family transport system substrate-binding protein
VEAAEPAEIEKVPSSCRGRPQAESWASTRACARQPADGRDKSGHDGWGLILATLVALVLALAPARAADAVKIGTLKLASYGPLYLAKEENDFAAEGLDAELVFFESAEPIAVAIVSGALDFGVSGSSGGLYSLAGQGALRIIGAGAHEQPGFQFFTLVASNRAYEAGFKSFKDLGGRAIAVSQVGSTSHYSVALVEEKYGIDPASVRILPLQSLSNQVSAVSGGQADGTVINATSILPVVERGDAKLVGFIGDEVPWQVGVVYASTKTVDGRGDIVQRFLRAYRKGARQYHDAFAAADGTRKDGPTADAVLAVLAKYTGQTQAQLRGGIAYVDADARLDVKDVLHQVEWYRAQGMVKGAVSADQLIDARTVVPLPPR